MRKLFTATTVVLMAVVLSSLTQTANAQGDKDKFKARYEANVGSKDFDPHDFTGIWQMTVLDHTFGTTPPALTPAGRAAMKGRVGDTPGVPRPLAEAAKTSPDVRLAGNGADSNAPWLQCNPMGFPRLMFDDEPMEFMMTKDKIVQVLQWEHRMRYLWTDGRQLPAGENLENLGPAWYGHSVAKWDGNTLTVDTVGLEEKAWLDNLGYPKSFHARIEEKWTMTDSNTLQLDMTLYDPEYYTAPWVGARKTFKRMPDDAITYFGWYGLFAGISEGICAPMNEVEGYNKGFHDVAKQPKK
jgi:hypothetical protein